MLSISSKTCSHMWIRVIDFPTQQEREKIEVGMYGFTSKKEPWEWDLNSRYLVTCNFHHIVFNKIPTDPYGNYYNGCHLWFSTPLVYATWSIVFLSFHSKMVSLVRENSMLIWSQQLGIVKSLHHRLTSFMLNLPDVSGFPPSR